MELIYFNSIYELFFFSPINLNKLEAIKSYVSLKSYLKRVLALLEYMKKKIPPSILVRFCRDKVTDIIQFVEMIVKVLLLSIKDHCTLGGKPRIILKAPAIEGEFALRLFLYDKYGVIKYKMKKVMNKLNRK